MNGISHKQAVQWIHRRLDGLLNESELLALAEHLRSCEFCRTYAAELDSLPAVLQSKFHARWDEDAGPSRKVLAYVTAKARRIPTSNRISSGVTLLAGTVALIVLAIAINFVVSRLQSTSSATNATETVDNASLGKNRLLAFSSDQNGNFDIYTMHANGSGLTNLTNHPANDTNPIWSPDDKHIAFESDRDGFKQIYIMDTDGSDVIQITKDEANHTLPLNYNGTRNPWSPDGSRLIFVQEESDGETATLYVIDIDGENKITLDTGKILPYEVSWSPDGKYIGYVLNASPTPNYFEPDIYVIESDGSNSRELKKLLTEGEQLDFPPYSWSSDGRSIVFVIAIVSMNAPLREMIYELDLQTNTIIRKIEAKPFVNDWTEEVSLTTEITQEGTPYYVWIRSDGTRNTFEASKAWGEPCSLDYTRSPRNNFAFGVYCPDTKFNLYWTNSDGSIITQLLTWPIDLVTGGVGDITWSPDDLYIAFSIESPGKTNMYVLNVAEARANPSVQPVQMPVSNSALRTIPSWQPMENENVAREVSTPQPTSTPPSGGMLAFTSRQNGNSDIYTIRADGSGMTNLTNNPAYDGTPFWSPDGKRIAFESDRDGFIQIYVMNADGSDVIQLTHDEADHFLPMNIHGETNPWSPDGNQLLFLQREPGAETSTLYSLDSNSGNVVILANGHVQFNNLSWSPDGKYIGYVLNDSPTPESTFVPGIYVVDVAGSNLIAINELLPPTDSLERSSYYWSRDGSSMIFIAYRHLDEGSDQWIAYEAILGSQQLIQRATSSTIMDDWWEGTSFVHGTDLYTLTWLRSDGTFSTVKPLEICDLTVEADYGFLARRSPKGSQVINIYCPNKDMWFYYASSDGSIVKPLMNSPIPSFTVDHSVTTMTWSSDDQFIAVTQVSPTKSSLYILSVNEPSTQPEEIVISNDEFYTVPSWRPVSNMEVVKEEQTPQPTQAGSFDDLIFFTAESDAVTNGSADIYTVRPDGSQRTNVTHDLTKAWNGDDYNPKWSPDRSKIAFISDRAGGNTGDVDIFTVSPDGNDLTRLTNKPGYDVLYAWSPSGGQIVYFSSSGYESFNPGQLIVMNSDGSNKTVITRELGFYYFRGWSPDGQKIIYAKQTLHDGTVNNNGSYIVDISGENEHQLSPVDIGDIHWEDSEHFVGIVWPENREQPEWSLYRFSADGTSAQRLASHASPIVAIFDETYVIESEGTLSWFAIGGSPTPLSSWSFSDICKTSDDQYFRTSHTLSPDRKLAFTSVRCEDSTWSYLVNEDGTQISRLGASIDGSRGLWPQWSTDGKYVSVLVFNGTDYYADTDLYLFDIPQMRNDPSVPPLRTFLGQAVEGERMLVWPPENGANVETKPPADPVTFPLSLDAAELLVQFDLLEPSYLPDGYALEGVAHDPWAQKLIMKYVSALERGSILLYQGRGDLFHYPELRPYLTAIEVGNTTGGFLRGDWANQSSGAGKPAWDGTANVYSLSWQKDGIVFSIKYVGEERDPSLLLDELRAIAESLK